MTTHTYKVKFESIITIELDCEDDEVITRDEIEWKAWEHFDIDNVDIVNITEVVL